jgi:hypothetical protein
MDVTRSGKSAANMYATRAPQSCPSTAEFQTESIGEVDRVLGQRHTCADARCFF